MKKVFEIGIYGFIHLVMVCMIAWLLIVLVMYGKTGYDRASKEYDVLPKAEFKLTDYLVNHYSDLRPDDVSITAINSKTYEKKNMIIPETTFDDYKVSKEINQTMPLRYDFEQVYFSVDSYFGHYSSEWSRMMHRMSQSTITIMISIAVTVHVVLSILTIMGYIYFIS